VKLYWKIYLFLSITTFFTLILTTWVSFSVLPAFMERQRKETLDRFEERILSGSITTREEMTSLADSINIVLRLLREDQQMHPPQGQMPPMPGQPFPEGREWGSVRIINIPGSQSSILATARMQAPRFPILVLFALVLFISQAIALGFGLKSVFRRTALLTTATGNFGKGKLTARYPDQGSHDEIDELGRAFNLMAERIITLLDSHNELLNSVAHELRTPMARLSFALELARDNPDTVREKLGLMEKDLFELDKLVSELLEFNRIGGTEPGHEKVSLSDLSHVAADGEKIHSPSVEISIREQGRTPSVTGDHRLLLRAISNLVRNAVNYADSTVTISIRSSGKNVLLSVTDDGPGFPPGFADRAVSPFIKGEKSKGTGLGLSIVQRIAEKHNGTLTIGNSPSGGASAELSIPV